MKQLGQKMEYFQLFGKFSSRFLVTLSRIDCQRNQHFQAVKWLYQGFLLFQTFFWIFLIRISVKFTRQCGIKNEKNICIIFHPHFRANHFGKKPYRSHKIFLSVFPLVFPKDNIFKLSIKGKTITPYCILASSNLRMNLIISGSGPP
jgi:hypothetical protein